MKRSTFPFLLVAHAGLTPVSAPAATILTGDVTATLGPDFFLDTAATGGGDFTVNQPASGTFDRSFGTLNVGAGGSTITIKGIGWASANSATTNDATSATVNITYLGSDGVAGGGNDVLIVTVTDAYTFAGAAGEYVWAFDTAISATIDGLNNQFRIVITPTNAGLNGSLSFKGATTASAANVKLSVAGTSVAVVPEPSAMLLGSIGLLGLLRRRRL